MNKYSYKTLLLAFGLTLSFGSCNDLSENDYFKEAGVRNENSDIKSTSQTVEQYIKSRSDLSSMSALFEKEGIYSEMKTSGELHTVLVVANNDYHEPEETELNTLARSHVTSISISPSKLSDKSTLKMWHNKYVTVRMDSLAQLGDLIGHTTFNNGTLMEVIKAEDGFVYVISDLIVTPISLQDFINDLDDTKFGHFKDLVLSSGGKLFDKNNSKVIGVDSQGNTLYDSVFIYTNDFFDAKGFNLSNEALTATMLYVSDDVINQALVEAKERLHRWNYDHKTELLRNGSKDSVYVGYSSWEDIEGWILKAAFFRNKYSAAELDPASSQYQQEIKSIYDIIWRNDIQVLDLANGIELSNGIAYEVKSFRIPNNRLIYRLHEEFRYFAQCDADQKLEFFKRENLTEPKVANNEVGEWTPLDNIWPLHANSPLYCKIADATTAHWQMDFTPIYSRVNNEGGYDVGALLVPPGAYRFSMGFKESMCDVSIQLFAVPDKDGEPVALGDVFSTTLPKGTNFNYDRGHNMSNMWPEYYDYKDERNTAGSKNSYYWTDGEQVYPEVVIPDFAGNGSPVRLLIRIWGESGTTYTGNVSFNHWCLRPTASNY